MELGSKFQILRKNCRLCLDSLEKDEFPIFENDFNDVSTIELILFCTGLEVQNDPCNLPCKICSSCHKSLKVAYKVKKIALATDKALKKYVMEHPEVFDSSENTKNHEVIPTMILETLHPKNDSNLNNKLADGAGFPQRSISNTDLRFVETEHQKNPESSEIPTFDLDSDSTITEPFYYEPRLTCKLCKTHNNKRQETPKKIYFQPNSEVTADERCLTSNIKSEPVTLESFSGETEHPKEVKCPEIPTIDLDSISDLTEQFSIESCGNGNYVCEVCRSKEIDSKANVFDAISISSSESGSVEITNDSSNENQRSLQTGDSIEGQVGSSDEIQTVFREARVYDIQSPSKSSHACLDCQRTFETSSELRDHEKIYHLAEPSYCFTCSKSFKSKSRQKRHKRLYHSDIPHFSCAICHKRYLHKERLIAHQSRKHPTLYECKICFTKFKSREEYKRHNKIAHVKTNKFICTFCNKIEFSHASDLKEHQDRCEYGLS